MSYGRSITDEEFVRQNRQTSESEPAAPAGNLEFKLTTDLTPIKQTVLTANFEEVEAQLRDLMAPYTKMVISPDDIADGKNVLARIRKVKNTIDDYRKSVKRDFTAPLTAFEERCKALTAVCSKSETNLSEQINKYAEQKKAEKRAELEAYFNANVGDMEDFVTFAQIENPKWGNVTFTLENAQAEIKQAIGMCRDGVDAIRSMRSEFESSLLDSYRKNHILSDAMKLNGELTEMKRREEERKEALRKKEEAERAAREAAQKAAEERREREAEELRKQMAAMPREPEPPKEEPESGFTKDAEAPTEQRYSITFRVDATRNQLFELKAACDRIGIQIKRV